MTLPRSVKFVKLPHYPVVNKAVLSNRKLYMFLPQKRLKTLKCRGRELTFGCSVKVIHKQVAKQFGQSRPNMITVTN